MSVGRLALVTGGAGFLGQPLCARLTAKGYRVRAADRRPTPVPEVDSRQVDLTEPAVWDELCRDVDVVFHLAAKTHAVAESDRDNAEYERLNVAMTRNLVQAAVSGGVGTIVFMSSAKVLGEGGATPLGDSDEPRPTTPYGRTKLAAENLVHTAGREHGLHTCVLRAPLMYGPGVKGNLAEMVAAIEAGKFPPLPETGNRRSLVDVRDVARALVLAAEEPAARGHSFLVTDGRGYSSREIQDLIRRALARPPLRWALPYAVFAAAGLFGDVLRRVHIPFPFDRTACAKLLGPALYDSSGIESALGFRPEHKLDEALSEMIP